MIIQHGSVDQSVYFSLVDPSTFATVTNPVITDLKLAYTRMGAAAVTTTLAELASATSAHADNSAKMVSAANAPGQIRVDFPDAAFAAGVDSVVLSVTGAAIRPEYITVDLVPDLAAESYYAPASAVTPTGIATRAQLKAEARKIMEEGIGSVLTDTEAGGWNDIYNWACRDVALDSHCLLGWFNIVTTADCIGSITVTDGASGYSAPPTITIADPAGGGVTATAIAVMADDGAGTSTYKVSDIIITEPGCGYAAADEPIGVTLTISDTGETATATATRSIRPDYDVDNRILVIERVVWGRDRDLEYVPQQYLESRTRFPSTSGTPSEYTVDGLMTSSRLRLYPTPSTLGGLVEIQARCLPVDLDPASSAGDTTACAIQPPFDKLVVQKMVMYACDMVMSDDIAFMRKRRQSELDYSAKMAEIKAKHFWPEEERVIRGIDSGSSTSPTPVRWERMP